MRLIISRPPSHEKASLALTLAGASVICVFLYAVGAALNHGASYYYLIWNLFLAWLPLGFVTLLIKYLRRHLWSNWPALLLTFLWLVFLPNSFYLVSDYLHIFDVGAASTTYNIAMFSAFAFNGLALGFLSLWLVHQQLLNRRHGRDLSWALVALALLVSSYAIYLGRYIRLNSWDVFTSFSAVLVSVSDQVLHPSGYPAVIGVSLSFFVLLAMMYLVIWRLAAETNIIEANERRISSPRR